MSATFRVRPAVQADGAFLADMVVEAVNWRQGGVRPRHEVIAHPDHSRYLSGWMRPTDAGFIAVDANDQAVGAAWYRMMPRADPGFGYTGSGVPELIIGVRPIWRAHGVGRSLLQHLCGQARAQGFARISLSVERGNFAYTLYRSEGFALTQPGGARDVMIKRLR